jgi:hypothetical protein
MARLEVKGRSSCSGYVCRIGNLWSKAGEDLCFKSGGLFAEERGNLEIGEVECGWIQGRCTGWRLTGNYFEISRS